MVIGILALQGAFDAHAKKLTALKSNWKLVKKPEDLVAIDGLIIPGGESGVLLKLMAVVKLDEALEKFGREGYPIFGTCAGMILLAKNVLPQQKSLGLIDITVQRNAYGRQIDSFIAKSDVSKKISTTAIFKNKSIELVFIRAPKIVSIDNPQVITLISQKDQPVMVQEDNILVASFHPELTEDSTVHEYFLSLCKS